MNQIEKNFVITMNISITSDHKGNFYTDPTSSSISQLLSKTLQTYEMPGDLRINKLTVLASQKLEGQV